MEINEGGRYIIIIIIIIMFWLSNILVWLIQAHRHYWRLVSASPCLLPLIIRTLS